MPVRSRKSSSDDELEGADGLGLDPGLTGVVVPSWWSSIEERVTRVQDVAPEVVRQVIAHGDHDSIVFGEALLTSLAGIPAAARSVGEALADARIDIARAVSHVDSRPGAGR